MFVCHTHAQSLLRTILEVPISHTNVCHIQHQKRKTGKNPHVVRLYSSAVTRIQVGLGKEANDLICFPFAQRRITLENNVKTVANCYLCIY